MITFLARNRRSVPVLRDPSLDVAEIDCVSASDLGKTGDWLLTKPIELVCDHHLHTCKSAPAQSSDNIVAAVWYTWLCEVDTLYMLLRYACAQYLPQSEFQLGQSAVRVRDLLLEK